MVALPVWLGAGVKVSVPVVASTAGATANRPGLLSPVTAKESVSPGGLPALLIEVAQFGTVTWPAFMTTRWLPPAVNEGAWLTWLTVTEIGSVTDPAWSVAIRSISAVPNWFGRNCKVSVAVDGSVLDRLAVTRPGFLLTTDNVMGSVPPWSMSMSSKTF